MAQSSAFTALTATAALILCLVSWWAAPSAAASKQLVNLNALTKLLPDKHDGKVLRTELKIFLSKCKLRRVPLSKKHAEEVLAKLYKEEKLVIEELAALEANLRLVNGNRDRNSLRVLQVDTGRQAKRDREGVQQLHKPNMSLTEVTQRRIDAWQQELESKRAEYSDIRTRIEETKNLARDPDQYISVPHSYGRIDPEKQRQIEREMLVRDRQAMEWRRQIAAGEIEALWLTDSW